MSMLVAKAVQWTHLKAAINGAVKDFQVTRPQLLNGERLSLNLTMIKEWSFITASAVKDGL